MHEFMEFVGAFCITLVVVSYIVYVLVAVVEIKKDVKDMKSDIENIYVRLGKMKREIYELKERLHDEDK